MAQPWELDWDTPSAYPGATPAQSATLDRLNKDGIPFQAKIVNGKLVDKNGQEIPDAAPWEMNWAPVKEEPKGFMTRAGEVISNLLKSDKPVDQNAASSGEMPSYQPETEPETTQFPVLQRPQSAWETQKQKDIDALAASKLLPSIQGPQRAGPTFENAIRETANQTRADRAIAAGKSLDALPKIEGTGEPWTLKDAYVDSAKLVMQGFANAVTVAGQGMKYAGEKTGVSGWETSGKAIRDLGSYTEDQWKNSLSDYMRSAAQNKLITGDFESGYGIGDTPIATIYASAMQSMPGMLVMGGAGGTVASILEGVAPRAATILMNMGLTEKVAERVVQFGINGVAFGGAEGIYSGLANAAQSGEEVLKLKPAQLESSAYFQEQMKKQDASLPFDERFKKAREEVAKAVEQQVLVRTAISTGAIGVLTGGGIMGQLNETARGTLRQEILKGLWKESPQEFLQSGPEQIIQNAAKKNFVNPEQDLMEDVVNQAVTGAAAGGLTGIAGGGIGFIKNQSSPEAVADRAKDAALAKWADLSKQIQQEQARKAAPPAPEESAKGILAATSIDEAITAAKTAVQSKPTPSITQPLDDELAAASAQLDRIEGANEPVGLPATGPTTGTVETALDNRAVAGDVGPVVPQAQTSTVADQGSPLQETASQPTGQAAQAAAPTVEPARQAVNPSIEAVSEAKTPETPRQSTTLQNATDRVTLGTFGKAPTSGAPVEIVRNAQGGYDLYQSGKPLLDYDSAEPITYPKGSTAESILADIKTKQKEIFGTGGKFYRDKGMAPAEKGQFTDFTQNDQVKTFKNERTAKLYLKSNKRTMPRGFKPREVDGVWRLSKPVTPEAQKPKVTRKTPYAALEPAKVEAIAGLRSEIGWQEIGGRLLRDEAGDVKGRTNWLAKSPFWPNRPNAISEKDAVAALSALEKNEPMSAAQKRFIDYAQQYLEREIQEQVEVDERKEADSVLVEGVPEAENLDAESLDTALDIADDLADDLADDVLFGKGNTDEIAFMRALGFTEEEINEARDKETNQGEVGETATREPTADTEGGGRARQEETANERQVEPASQETPQTPADAGVSAYSNPFANDEDREAAISAMQERARAIGFDYADRYIRDAFEFGASKQQVEDVLAEAENESQLPDLFDSLIESVNKARGTTMKQGFGPKNTIPALPTRELPDNRSDAEKVYDRNAEQALYALTDEELNRVASAVGIRGRNMSKIAKAERIAGDPDIREKARAAYVAIKEPITPESGNTPESRANTGVSTPMQTAATRAAEAMRAAADAFELAAQTPQELAASQTKAAEEARQKLEEKRIADLEAERPLELQSEDKRAESDTQKKIAAQGSIFDQAPQDAPAPAPKEVGNFGEQLPPPRRAMSKRLSEDLTDNEIVSMPFSKLWPQSEVDAITDIETAALVQAARDVVPPKPRADYKLRRWVEDVKRARQMAQEASEAEPGYVDRMMKLASEKGRYSSLVSKFFPRVKAMMAIPREQWPRLTGVEVYPEAYSYDEAGNKTLVPHTVIVVDGKRTTVQGAAEVNDAVIGAISTYMGVEPKAPKMKFEVRGVYPDGKYHINYAGDPERRMLAAFSDAKAGLEYVKSNYDDLVLKWEEIKARDNVNKADVRNAENRGRIGTDYRNGKDATAEQFESTFGFRGGEFGKWVSQGSGAKERQGLLNQAYDALMDLAILLDIPPKAISLNGSLGIAFGSRGSGSASAHFEPSNLVINLTKTRGAGTLAHEWFHALDNYFARQRNDGQETPFTGDQTAYRRANYITYRPEPVYVSKRSPNNGMYLTAEQLKNAREKRSDSPYYAEENWIVDPNHKQGVRPEVEKAFAELVEALNKSPMKDRASANDKGADGYWSRIIERGARAFENYVIYKLAQRGQQNDFLANVKPLDEFARNKDRYPYLVEQEIPAIAEKFDAVFSKLETRETETGTALFSRGSIWYSQMSRQIETLMGNQEPAKQLAVKLQAWAKAGKFKSDELQWSGLMDWLDLQQGKVTKEQVMDYLNANGVQVTETMLGEVKERNLIDKDIAPEVRYLESRGISVVRHPDDPTVVGFIVGEDGGDIMGAFEIEDAQGDDQYPEIDARAAEAALNVNDYISGEDRLSDEDYAADSPNRTKFSQYVLPGGENYRELLLTLPTAPYVYGKAGNMEIAAEYFPRILDAIRDRNFAERDRLESERDAKIEAVLRNAPPAPFRSSHFDQPNILAHIRFNERTDAEGNRVLFIEEIQSDWGQSGKKRGFTSAAVSAEKIESPKTIPGNGLRDRQEQQWKITLADGRVQERSLPVGVDPLLGAGNSDGAPPAPFVQKTEAWVALALKRMIRYAAENGFDRVAFTTGEQQAERYDLSKQIDSIRYIKANGTYDLTAISNDGRTVIDESEISADRVEEIVGKEILRKIDDGAGTKFRGDIKELRGLDLKVGGEGMRAFYDKILPNVANDVLKKLGGGKVAQTLIPSGEKLSENIGEGSLAVVSSSGDLIALTDYESQAWQIARETAGATVIPATEVKRNGALVPSFDITPTMRDKALEGLPLFAKGGRGKPITFEDARAAVDVIKAKWKNAPKINVWESIEKARESLRDEIERSNAFDARGAWYEGEIHIFPQNITDMTMLERTVVHEARHAGLEGVFGRDLNSIMMNLYMNNPGLRREVNALRRRAEEEGETPLSVVVQVNEVLADKPLDYARKLSGWSKLVGRLKAWFEENGFTRLAALMDGPTADEITRDVLYQAEKWIRDGKPSTTFTSGAMFSKMAESTSIKRLADFWQAYAKRDDAFRFGASESTDTGEILKGIGNTGNTFTPVMKSQSYATLEPEFPNQRESEPLPALNTKNNLGHETEYATLNFTVNGGGRSVFIRINDMDRFPRNVSGAAAYQALMTWAVNNGYDVKPDTTLIAVNRLRRTEVQISMMLKYGEKAGNIEPHEEQYIGLLSDADYQKTVKNGMDHDVPERIGETLKGMKDRLWKDPRLARTDEEKREIFTTNLENLLIASAALTYRRVPELNDVVLSGKTFTDFLTDIPVFLAGSPEQSLEQAKRVGRDGSPLLGKVSVLTSAPKTGVGETTGFRALVTKSLLPASVSWSDLYASAAMQQRKLLPDAQKRSGVLALGGEGAVSDVALQDAIDALGPRALYSRNVTPPDGGVSVSRALFSRPIREQGLNGIKGAVTTFRSVDELKSHPRYTEAKAGDLGAAEAVVRDLVNNENVEKARSLFGDNAIYVYPHAEEATGKNKIPAALAHFYAAKTGGVVAEPIVQTNRAFHTGASMMERMLARPLFDGEVKPGRYVVVDDVTTGGSTLSELADHVRANGGTVIGAITLTDASRTGTLLPSKKAVELVTQRFGDEIRNQFSIDPAALTDAEARYLSNFGDVDQLRTRIATARRDRGERLLSKGIQEELTSNNSTPDAPAAAGVSTSGALFSRGLGLTGGQSKSRSSWDSPNDSKIDNILFVLQDKQIDLKRVTQKIREASGELKDTWNAYLKEELYHGRTAKRVDNFIDKELRPLLTDMQARGVSIPDFEKYLHARHAEERNIQIAKINEDFPDGGSGMMTQDAKDYLESLPADKKKAFEALAKRIDAITAGTRQTLKDYGLITQDDIDQWSKLYPHYVPLMRDEGGMGTGMGFSIKGDETKRAMGSSKGVVDILANIAQQREKAIVRGEKNRVALALYGLAKTNPNPDFWKTDKPPMIRYIDQAGMVAERVDPTWKNADNVVVAKANKDGKVYELAVVFNEDNDRAVRMAKSLKNLDLNELGEILSTLGKATRFLAAVNTQYNPIFGIVNLVRDTQGVAFNLESTALAGKQVEVMKNIAPALLAVYRAERGFPSKSEWTKLWDEMQEQGGTTGYRQSFSTTNERAEAMADEIKKITEGKLKRAGRAAFDWLSDYNQAMENGTRLSVYKAGLDAGLSKEQAASISKNITVNFNRKGHITSQAASLYAFFNASVQGTARLAETLASKAGKKIVMGGLLLGVIQAVLLAAASGDEDEPPQFDREKNLIIPLGDKQYVKIPMALGLHVIPNTSRILTEAFIYGKPLKRMAQLLGVFADAFNPTGAVGLSFQTLAPTAFDPLVALTENRDWTGKPIAREDFSSLNPTPGHSRAKDTATWGSRQLAEFINWSTGGSEFVKGGISPTPDQLDYLVGQVTGGVGREIQKIVQTVGAQVSGEELPTYKIPLVGRFYSDSKNAAAVAALYYRNIKEQNEHEATIKGLYKQGRDASDYIRANPDAQLFQAANAFERKVSEMVKYKRELVKRDAPREEVKRIEEMITENMRQFNQVVSETKARKSAAQ